MPTQLEFVDIAGLVRGASQGQGLGNQFLGHIREVDAIAQVLRCFEDDNVVHVEGSVDPIRDAETVETELMLADLDSLERRVVAAQKRARGGEQGGEARSSTSSSRCWPALRDGKPARRAALPAEQQHDLQGAATADRQAGALYRQCRRGERRQRQCARAAGSPIMPRRRGRRPVVISAAIEAEVAHARRRRRESASFSPRSASARPGSTASSAPATRCST